MRLFFFLCSCLLILPLISSAQALPENHVKIRLLAERAHVQAGETFWIGVEETIEEGWHTYWRNPGDSGMPPRITWDMPSGFKIGEIQYPPPQKIPYDSLVNYGYTGTTTLLQKLTVPLNFKGGAFEIKAHVDILVCKDICIPQRSTYSLKLNDPEALTQENTTYFKQAESRLPKPLSKDVRVHYGEEDGMFVLRWPENLPQDAVFIPEDWGIVDNAAQPVIDGTLLKQKRGARPLSELSTLRGVLVSSRFTADFVTEKEQVQGTLSVWTALVFAFLGGLILNLMPCVFPVLSMKALSLVRIAEKHPSKARLYGLFYTAGVMTSFLMIAGVLFFLRSSGAQIGWGFQLQNPFIVGMLAYLLWVLGLNFMGFFEFSNPFGHWGAKHAQKGGLVGTFFTGTLATLVATPCTAPFMAGAIGFAMLQPAPVSLLIFGMLGLGLSLPYLLLSFVPAFQKILPRPGKWMEVFRQFLAFPVFASALWLVWVLGEQAGIASVIGVLEGGLLIALSLWSFRHSLPHRAGRILVRLCAIGFLALALNFLPLHTNVRTDIVPHEKTFGVRFSQGQLETLLQGNDPVFVEMTAAWCITCKINHMTALDIAATRALFKEHQVQYLIGDWTREDPEITAFLRSHGRQGVPLYVYYGPRNAQTGQRPAPHILPQILTPSTIYNTILPAH